MVRGGDLVLVTDDRWRNGAGRRSWKGFIGDGVDLRRSVRKSTLLLLLVGPVP